MSDEVTSPQENTDSELTPETDKTDNSITLTRRMVAAAGVVILLAVGASSFALGRVTADDSSDLGDHPALAQRGMREHGQQGGMRERGQQGGMRERGGPGQGRSGQGGPREHGQQGGMRERGQQGGMRERGQQGEPDQSTPSTTAPVVPGN